MASPDAPRPGQTPDRVAFFQPGIAESLQREDEAMLAAIAVPQAYLDLNPESSVVVDRVDPETGITWSVNLEHRNEEGRLGIVRARPNDPTVGTLILAYSPGVSIVADGVATAARSPQQIAESAQALFTRLFPETVPSTPEA